MKKTILIAGILLVGAQTQAQTLAKRYVLIEHFTNSWCSVCASKNPDFYKTYDLNAKDLHHISYHPNIPYEQCIFYQANKTENTNRTTLYEIQSGTPRVVLNGELAALSTPLLPTAVLTSKLGKTSPVSIAVKETVGALSFKTDIEVSRLGAVAAGNYRLYVALVEKNVGLTTPNGEKNHRDVFRVMLNGINGAEYKAGPAGDKTVFSYSLSSLDPAWKTNELYTVAFIQNTGTKEILNSGTRFDPQSSGIFDKARVQQINIAPNPVNEVAYTQLGDDEAESVEVYALSGQRIVLDYTVAQNQVQLETAELHPGIYILKITGKKNTYSARILKQ